MRGSSSPLHFLNRLLLDPRKGRNHLAVVQAPAPELAGAAEGGLGCPLAKAPSPCPRWFGPLAVRTHLLFFLGFSLLQVKRSGSPLLPTVHFLNFLFCSVLFFFLFFLSFFWGGRRTRSIWKFPGWRSNWNYSRWPTPQPQQPQIRAEPRLQPPPQLTATRGP